MEKKNTRRKILDKVLMGAVIGGAIGSVVGASISPKKGKETRKDIVDMAKRAKTESQGILKKIIKIIIRRKKKIPHENV